MFPGIAILVGFMNRNGTACASAEGRWRGARRPVSATHDLRSVYGRRSKTACLKLLLACALFIGGGWRAFATVAAVSVQSPLLSTSMITSVITPIHFAATADSNLKITGYVVYVDGNNIHRNFSPSLDAWSFSPRAELIRCSSQRGMPAGVI